MLEYKDFTKMMVETAVVRTDRRHRTFPSGCFWFRREGGGAKRKRGEEGVGERPGSVEWRNHQAGQILCDEEQEAARHSGACDERARGLGPTAGI